MEYLEKIMNVVMTKRIFGTAMVLIGAYVLISLFKTN